MCDEQKGITPLHLEIYRRLAMQLDAMPNRFPVSKSGVELRLLAKLFNLEEATLAGAMHLEPESISDIAVHAGVDPKNARDLLKKMAAKGLIDLKKGDGQFVFALKPFVVGFYETQMPRMDKEMALLFEEYFRETQGRILREVPALHRIIPVDRAIPFQIEIHPFERATELLEGAAAWGVRKCICRVQQQLVGKGCDRPIESCIVFSPVKNAFDKSTSDRAITKEEALQILRDTEEAGLVHSSGNYRDGIDYICNCCICCCGIMRGIAEYGIQTAVARSDFHIILETEMCSVCGACIDRCQFNALSISDVMLAIDDRKCMGCGLCVTVCPSEALHLERRHAGEVSIPPADIVEWRAQRLTVRDKTSTDIT